ncbi:MAG: PAS domain-containing protein [Verrucomicrobia bacterium]|nr:PAS domain-containing protein [Verrucomicrobiota bacterium]
MADISSFQSTGESRVLELIATGRPLGEILPELAHAIEAQAEGMLCSVLLLDKDGKHLRHGAAPSLPAEYNQRIDGVAIGPCVGSCGTAAFTGQPVIVTDIASDPLWKEFAALARQHQLRACWSVPIKSGAGTVIGTFAMYYRAPRRPADAELQLIGRAGHLAGIAIERHQAESREMQQMALFQGSLLSLRDHEGDELPVFFRNVTASVARALQIERASIWLLDAGHTILECQDLFLRGAQAHERGLRLAAADYPRYFKAITSHESVLADDAHAHPATSEFSAGYLRPLGITSLLDVPIRTGGRLLGVLCCEHTGPARQWSAGENKFAIAAANYVTLALEQAERRRAEAALRASEERHRLLITSSRDAMMTIAPPTWKFTSCNPAALELFGVRDEAEFCTLGPWNVSPEAQPDGRPSAEKAEAMIATALREGSHFFEWTHQRMNGRPFHATVLLSRTEHAGQVFLQATVRDITAQKQAEAALREMNEQLDRLVTERTGRLRASEARFRAIFTTEPECVKVVSPDGDLVEMNTAGLAMLEVDSLAAAQARPLIHWVAPEYHGAFQRLHQAVMRGETETLEFELVGAKGTRRWLDTHAAPLRNERGEVSALLGVSRDITERKRAEIALAQEHNLLRTLIDNLPHFVYIKDTQGRYVLHNEANARSKGLKSAAEGLGKTVFDYFPGEIARLYHQDDLKVLQTGQPIFNREEPFISPDGARGWLATNKVPLRDAGGNITGLVGVSRDVTERITAQAEMRRLASFAAHNPNPVLEFSAAGQVVYKNAATDKLLRQLNKPLLSEILPPDTVALVARCLAENQSILRVEIEIAERTISWSFFPIAEVRAVHCYGGDITGRTHAEAERADMERKLQETQKLESLGVLAGGIAHDFNNLLTGILGNAGLARMFLAPGGETHRYLEQIEQSSLRAAELCKQMLAYSGRGRFVIQPLDISALAHDMTQLLQMSISKKAVLKLTLAPGLPAISADATQLRQILMNLVINASEAIGERSGVITVHTGLQRADAEYLDETYPSADYMKEGDYVFLEVSDNGCGMTPDIKARIFEPFFTTKFTGRGLGLAAVLGIIRGHKGALKVYSEPGRGSTFKLLLPCAQGQATAVADTPAAGSDWRGTGLALVVDDEETVRAVTARMLEAFGFEVVLAADGREGLAKFQAQPGRFKIVLLDLTMPHMDGEETFREIRRVRPDTRVLLMSGFNEQDASGRFLGKGLAGFIQKPFQPDALRNKLRAILGGK